MHDVEHPGVSNAFLIATGSDLAAVSLERHCLEQHHCRVGLRLLAQCRLLAALPEGEARTLRGTLVSAVLATDMACHKEQLAAVVRRAAAAAAGTAPVEAPASAEDRTLLVALALHCADLHSSLLEPEADRFITDLVFEEFEAQAERERDAGLPVSVLVVPTPAARAGLETGFITFVVRPLFSGLVALLPDTSLLLDRIDRSLAMWTAAASAERATASAGRTARMSVATSPSRASRRSVHFGSGGSGGGLAKPSSPPALVVSPSMPSGGSNATTPGAPALRPWASLTTVPRNGSIGALQQATMAIRHGSSGGVPSPLSQQYTPPSSLPIGYAMATMPPSQLLPQQRYYPGRWDSLGLGSPGLQPGLVPQRRVGSMASVPEIRESRVSMEEAAFSSPPGGPSLPTAAEQRAWSQLFMGRSSSDESARPRRSVDGVVMKAIRRTFT